MNACVLFYCRDVKLVEWLEVEPYERMVVTVDPERSDLEFGRGTWLLASDEQGTVLDYEVEMKPLDGEEGGGVVYVMKDKGRYPVMADLKLPPQAGGLLIHTELQSAK